MEMTSMTVQRVISVVTSYYEAGHGSTRMNRPSAAIILKWEGRTEYRVGGKTIISDAAHPVLLPKGVSYTWRCMESGRYTIVEFDTDDVSDMIVSFSYPDTEKMKSLLHNTERARMSKSMYGHIEQMRAIYELLAELFSSLVAQAEYIPSKKLERIRPAVEYINEHYSEPLTNEQLAALTDVSCVYFRKIFTLAYGMPPISFVNRVRIEKAKEMLKSDYGSLASVAESVGYSNVYHFSKMFKKLTGISPGKYARGMTI